MSSVLEWPRRRGTCRGTDPQVIEAVAAAWPLRNRAVVVADAHTMIALVPQAEYAVVLVRGSCDRESLYVPAFKQSTRCLRSAAQPTDYTQTFSR